MSAPLVLRPPRPGDLGWITHRHGVLYAREHGYGAPFEALVARIVSDFARDRDPRRDRLWLADAGPEGAEPGADTILGAIAIMHAERPGVGLLRLFYVEPTARGRGIGRQLFDTALDFARAAGYQRLSLHTQKNLHAARAIYQRAGFQLVASSPHQGWGDDLVDEHWELDLTPPAGRTR